MGFRYVTGLAVLASVIGMAGSSAAQAGPAEDWERSHADLATLQGPWTDPIYGDEYTIEGNRVILTRKGANTQRSTYPDRFVVMSNLRFDRSSGDEYHYFKGTCHQPPIPGQRGILSLEREFMVNANVNVAAGGRTVGFSSVTATCVPRSTRPEAAIGGGRAAPQMRPPANPVAQAAMPASRPSAMPPPASLPVTSAQEQTELTARERLNREQAAAAARQNAATKAAFDQATADRAATIARQQAEHQAAVAAVEAERVRRAQEYEAQMAKWRADVAACKAGDKTRCGPQ